MSEELNSGSLRWVLLILLILPPSLNSGEYWGLEVERDLYTRVLWGHPENYVFILVLCTLRGIMSFHPTQVMSLEMVTFHLNMENISISAFRREKEKLHNVSLGENGAIAILFPHHLSTFSLTSTSLLSRTRVPLILSQFFYPLPLRLARKYRRDACFVLVHGVWFHWVMNSGWATDGRCQHQALAAVKWKGSFGTPLISFDLRLNRSWEEGGPGTMILSLWFIGDNDAPGQHNGF